MRITRLDAQLLRVPVAKATPLPMTGSQAVGRPPLAALLVQVETDAGPTGLGVGLFGDGGRALLAAISEFAPLLRGENPLNHERLFARTRALDGAAAKQAYAVVDVALWDLKGKAAGLPLWRLLGGARDAAPVHAAESAGACLTADETITIARSCLGQGMRGVRVSMSGLDPEADAHKLQAVRDALGEDVWLAVTAGRSYDYETALPMGRFIEEEVAADWFEDPLADDDVTGYARLTQRIDTPLAVGGRYTEIASFVRYVESGARGIFRPDVLRLGGLTAWLKVAALAEAHRRPVVPRLLPEVSVQLACGLPGVQAVEYVPWLAGLFTEPLMIAEGTLVPPARPGLGLELNPDAVARLRISDGGT